MRRGVRIGYSDGEIKMKMARVFRLLTIVVLLSGVTHVATAEEQEHVTFYPAYGYTEEGTWIIPLRVRVYEDITRASRAARLA